MTDRSTRWILWAKPEDADAVARPRTSPRTGQELFRADPAPLPQARSAREGLDLHDVPVAVEVRPAHRRSAVSASSGLTELLDRIISERLVEVLFQPIVGTLTDQIVGYEALARGPKGPLQFPDRLFAAARAAGRAGELDSWSGTRSSAPAPRSCSR